MSLIYGLVARGSVILAEHTNSTGNFTQGQLHLEPHNPLPCPRHALCCSCRTFGALKPGILNPYGRLLFFRTRYLFHYICEDGLTYMCMADDSFNRRIPFAFLQDIKERFLTAYGRDRPHSALPYGMNEFSKTIAKQMVCLCKRILIQIVWSVQERGTRRPHLRDWIGRAVELTLLRTLNVYTYLYTLVSIILILSFGLRMIWTSKEYYSTNPNADRLKQVHGEIEQVKDVMVHNIGMYIGKADLKRDFGQSLLSISSFSRSDLVESGQSWNVERSNVYDNTRNLGSSMRNSRLARLL
ncbi:regulated-snare-like domain-containing protein [Jimgerdemannia flammicorona]|uniref:Regulated-snare-like domain-containing protein n=1 Tax=Jimgerdemannia flammicorona TaxID=994334 RepID=A0A433B989_9FUNG|nr:regulated-snare-like domain-containing protein [Jimgerdemannia flammicorona]